MRSGKEQHGDPWPGTTRFEVMPCAPPARLNLVMPLHHAGLDVTAPDCHSHQGNLTVPSPLPLGDQGLPQNCLWGQLLLENSWRGLCSGVLGVQGCESSMSSVSQMSLTRCSVPTAASPQPAERGNNKCAAVQMCLTRSLTVCNKIFQIIKAPEWDYFRYAIMLCY